jgi:hypothetical protein
MYALHRRNNEMRDLTDEDARMVTQLTHNAASFSVWDGNPGFVRAETEYMGEQKALWRLMQDALVFSNYELHSVTHVTRLDSVEGRVNVPYRYKIMVKASPSSLVADGAGSGGSAPEADAVKRDRIRRYQAATKEYTDAYRTYGIAVKDHRPDAEHWHNEVLRTHAALDAIAKEA